MKINSQKDGTQLVVAIEGRLDTTSAPQLEEAMKESLPGVEMLAFDFSALEYISSAGLRVLLSTQKVMNKQGKMVIRKANDVVKEVFDMTGFSDILTLED